MSPGGKITRRDSEMLAQGASRGLQPGFSLEKGVLSMVYQVGVDFF